MVKTNTFVHEYSRHLLILHATTEASSWCESCAKENSMAFERFVQIDVKRFADISDECSKSESEKTEERILSIIEKSKEPWILLLFGDIGLEHDLLASVQHRIISDSECAVIYSERSMVDGTIIHMPRHMKNVPYDMFGAFPSNLLIRKSLLEDVLHDPHGVFLPNPVMGILRILLDMGIDIAGEGKIGIIHNAPMSCLIGQCGLYEWKQHLNKKRRILVLTHELSLTGAPIVLQEACTNVLKPAGYELFVAAPESGRILGAYLDADIPVMISPALLNKELSHVSVLAHTFDLVIVNTNVLWAAACVLNTMSVPVLWWIHDAESGYQRVKAYMPKALEKNMHVYCVGEYAKEALLKHQPAYRNVQTMIYGVRDENAVPVLRKAKTDDRVEFVCIGSISERKGQDILCRAIGLLPEDVRKNCRFTIVGKVMEKPVFSYVEKTMRKYPEQIVYAGEVSRKEVYQIYTQADCVICASRDDPMPTFVSEGMMFSKPSICSENTGTAKVLKHGVDGLIYEKNDPKRLAESIEVFVRMPPVNRIEMGTRARALFLREFELEQFKKKLIDAIEYCVHIVE